MQVQALQAAGDPGPEPRQDTGTAPSLAALQILQVGVQDMQCAIDLRLVECVLPLMHLQQVPGGACYLAGLMNYRGESVAVVDLGIWLGNARVLPYDLDTPVVLCNDGQVRVGFVVTTVMGVREALPRAHQMRAAFKGSESPFQAALDTPAGVDLLLDMPRIMRLNFVAPGITLAAARLPIAQEPP